MFDFLFCTVFSFLWALAAIDIPAPLMVIVLLFWLFLEGVMLLWRSPDILVLGDFWIILGRVLESAFPLLILVARDFESCLLWFEIIGLATSRSLKEADFWDRRFGGCTSLLKKPFVLLTELLRVFLISAPWLAILSKSYSVYSPFNERVVAPPLTGLTPYGGSYLYLILSSPVVILLGITSLWLLSLR